MLSRYTPSATFYSHTTVKNNYYENYNFHHSACIEIKWKFNISDCNSLLRVQKPAKTVYFKTCSECPPPAFTQVRSLLTKLSIALLMEFCGRSYCLQDILQLVDGIRLGLKCLAAFKHSSPDMIIKKI